MQYSFHVLINQMQIEPTEAEVIGKLPQRGCQKVRGREVCLFTWLVKSKLQAVIESNNWWFWLKWRKVWFSLIHGTDLNES